MEETVESNRSDANSMGLRIKTSILLALGICGLVILTQPQLPLFKSPDTTTRPHDSRRTSHSDTKHHAGTHSWAPFRLSHGHAEESSSLDELGETGLTFQKLAKGSSIGRR